MEFLTLAVDSEKIDKVDNAVVFSIDEIEANVIEGAIEFPSELNQSINYEPGGGSNWTDNLVIENSSHARTKIGVIVVVISYCLILIVGILGNTSVLLVAVKIPKMRTVTNLFIFNLAVADLLVLIFCVGPTMVSNIYIVWILGRFLCKTVPYIQGVSVCASVYTLVAISFERCLAIRCPLRPQLTKKLAGVIIIGIWLWSLFVTLPWALFFQITRKPVDSKLPEGPYKEYCWEIWPEGYESKYYFIFGTVLLCYVIPLVLIGLCYFMIYYQVWSRPMIGDMTMSTMEIIHNKAKTGVIKMLLVVVILFALSWLPLYLIFFRIKVINLKFADWEKEVIRYGVPIAQWLGSFNSCINPLLYAFMSIKFRRSFASIICPRRSNRPPTPHHLRPNLPPRPRIRDLISNHSSLYHVTEV